ncbi:hypothetical protein SAMN04487866_13215 [Thermoactinomyces sp. DSM 45891]|uniref:hypothetical protein n=1 Tax=Thermoactinomyces sp. DSM 45891 TaxID=1761907 RepID=UPI0009126976|nr:hypothetical protein [Thermoactinomyces sp. DSM 45891]SFX82582.1 hypothetical protein SAMN04487866_13215 [Thermoactinomyces sp. DSM 45891]
MEQEMKELVTKSIRESRDEVLNHFKFIIHEYPYHPDTKFFLLDLQGHSGDFGVAVSAMGDWGHQLFKNAHGEPDNDLVGFGISSMSGLSRAEIREDMDLVDDIDSFTKDYIPVFLQECFNEVGGKESKFPFYLHYNNGDVYDFMAEEFPDYIEGLDA